MELFQLGNGEKIQTRFIVLGGFCDNEIYTQYGLLTVTTMKGIFHVLKLHILTQGY